MLGLRKNFSTGKRFRKSSASSSLNSPSIDEEVPGKPDSAEMPPSATMETVRAGLHSSLHGVVGEKAPKQVEVVVRPIDVSAPPTPLAGGDGPVSSDSERTVSVAEEKTASVAEEAVSATSTTSRVVVGRTRPSEPSSILAMYRSVRRSIFQLDDYTYNDEYFEQLSYESYQEFVDNERLIRMPRRGSYLDRALRAAQIFGQNLWSFGLAIEHFTPDTRAASLTGLASCRILLEIEHNSVALVPTFHALNELALLVSQVTQIDYIFRTDSSPEAKQTTADLYSDLVRFVGDVAVYYKKKIDGISSGTVTIQFDAVFGDQLSHIWARKDKIVSDIWRLKLGARSEGIASVRQSLDARSTRDDFYKHIADGMRRAEDSCEWFKTHLVDFFRSSDKVFTVTGPAGSGKTVLARWVKERLQRPLDRTTYHTLHYVFPFDFPTEATALSFLKSILFQLLERNVGDVHMYEKLVVAFAGFSDTRDGEALEAALWTALGAGLRTAEERGHRLVVIVDGFDEIAGVNPSAFHRALRERVQPYKTTRVITLSRPLSHISEGCRHLTLDREFLSEDVAAFLSQRLSALKAFNSLGETARDGVVEQLAEKAKNSFLWAALATDLLAKSPADAIPKTVKPLTSSLDDLLHRLAATLPLKTEPARRILTFLLLAGRPLTTAELAELIRVDLKKRELGPSVDVAKEIPQLFGRLVTVQEGRVHFASGPVKEFLLGLLGNLLPQPAAAQLQLVSSLLLYARLSLPDPHEPSFDEIDPAVAESYFRSSPLLEYAVAHWPHHFRASSLVDSAGAPAPTAELRQTLPDSALLALLERHAWQTAAAAEELVGRHELALRVREGAFEKRGVSTLQTLITLAVIHGAADPAAAAGFYYRAATLGQVVLSRTNTVTLLCVSRFLHITDELVFTSRTEVVTWRIQMIELMIEISKAKSGAHGEAVLKWHQALAELYVGIREEYNATVVYKLIYEIVVVLEGKQSSRARGIARHFGGLDIVLHGGDHKKKVEEVEEILLETSEAVDPVEAASVDIRLRLVQVYASQQKWALAEEVFVALWRGVSAACRARATRELHLAKLRIAIEYVKFLRRLERTEEAVNILTVLWVEYEDQALEEAAVVLRIKEVGEFFKAFGLLDVAVSVFSKVWGWFKASGRTADEEALRTTVLITEVVEEITTTMTRTKTTTTTAAATTTTTTTETVVRDVYESHHARCRGAKRADATFFGASFALIKLYQKLESWERLEVVVRQTLEVSWAAVLSAEVTVGLAEQFVSESIAAAYHLGICYHRQGKLDRAEEIYLRIFRACAASLGIEHTRIAESLNVLVAFYEEHHRHEKTIAVYAELLEKYRKQLGPSHKLTIELLYKLAAESRRLGRREEFAYYAEIVAVLNEPLKHCHVDAQRAALLLVEHYHEARLWAELQAVCAALWESYVRHHKEARFEEHEIEALYGRYVAVLELHAKASAEVVYAITKEYHVTASLVFGAAAAIVVRAMIAFAGVCERSEKHYHEAVSVYEEVIKRVTTTTTTTTTTTVITETEITRVKTRLSRVYVTIVTSGASTTATTIERGIALSVEAYENSKLQLGWWHESTLLKLREVALLHQKSATEESRKRTAELLQASFLGIVTSTSVSSTQLHSAAVSLAGIYSTAGLLEQAGKLAREVLHVALFGTAFAASALTLKLGAKVTKASFVFLAAFTLHLGKGASPLAFSEVLSGLLLEASLYERYAAAVAGNTTRIELLLEHGARLRAAWAAEPARAYLVAALDAQLFAVFRSKFTAYLAEGEAAQRELYLALLAALAAAPPRADFAVLACRAANARVAELLGGREFARALALARCAFRFASGQRLYHDVGRVQFGYKLAELMAGIDARAPADPKLREEMLRTSSEILAAVLEVFRAEGIEFSRLRFADLAGIIRLLGSQGQYKELERILLGLWHSREVVRSWRPDRVLSIGLLLVHAHAATGRTASAVALADRMRYNLRRSRGPLDKDALAATELLAALQPRRAHAAYEEVLREVDSAAARGAAGASADLLARTATRYLELLRRVAPRGDREVSDLYARLAKSLGVKVPPPETWGKENAVPQDGLGKYVAPKEWVLLEAGGK